MCLSFLPTSYCGELCSISTVKWDIVLSLEHTISLSGTPVHGAFICKHNVFVDWLVQNVWIINLHDSCPLPMSMPLTSLTHSRRHSGVMWHSAHSVVYILIELTIKLVSEQMVILWNIDLVESSWMCCFGEGKLNDAGCLMVNSVPDFTFV